MKGQVLLVDDDQSMRDVLVEEVSRMGFSVESAQNAEDACLHIRQTCCDCVVTDLKMAGADGFELCHRINEIDPNLPVIIITAFGSIETAIGAIRAGAYDFLTKPFEMDALCISLEKAIRYRNLCAEVHRLRETLGAVEPIGSILGESRAIVALATVVDRVADAEVSVLISGETGTGKELVAQALHARSRRKNQRFVPVNCAALPENLLESELFGHRKGAFTGAQTDHRGLFVEADKGTLFLDEIGDLPLGLQAKLLRALQERRVRPVGSSTEVPFDIRLVAATNVDLAHAVEEGTFREDLLYRINVVRIDVPPLRARGNDILLLAQHFLTRAAKRSGKEIQGLTAPVAERLLGYNWAGNVRELQNCIERAVALSGHRELVVDDLPPAIRDHQPKRLPVFSYDPSQILPMAEVERRYILHVLEQLHGSRTQAARLLRLDRKTLYRKLRQYGYTDEE